MNLAVTLPGWIAASNAGDGRAFNRIYIATMFAVIIAIGTFGVFALARSQATSDDVGHSFENAADVNDMLVALEREQSEITTAIRRRDLGAAGRFERAAQTFTELDREVQRDGWKSAALLRGLARSHARLTADASRIFAALRHGDGLRAFRIDGASVRPNVTAMRDQLDATAAVIFDDSEAAAAQDRRSSAALQQLIVAVTAIGIALMTGFAFLLGRYRHAKVAADAKTLAALEQAALTDGLTGLGNNRSFYDDFDREIARAKRHEQSLVLALIDVDDFKAVNDKGGHSHGDAVLARVGERLRTMRPEDRGYRIGGDEFALLLVETSPAAAAIALARLQTEIRDSGLGATVSIGYANLAGDRLSTESYELADTALYEAKRRGRNQTVAFDEITGTVSVFSPRKADAVRTMIARGMVRTAFQPIWDVASTRPIGFEALARPFAELDLSGPQEAFDIAQRIRQLPELDALCVRRTLESAANLPPGAVVFLNYSPASLTHADFDAKAFVAAIRAAGLAPGQIVMELTERRIDDPAMVAKRAASLSALGVRIALDDTGSGHAGLEILSKVHFDFVKIDRSLIVDAMASAEARGVLAGIIAIAREIGSYLIAEGVETAGMLDFVRTAHVPTFDGIRGIQGYLLGRPRLGSVDCGALEDAHDVLAGCLHLPPVSAGAERPEPVTARPDAEPPPLRESGMVRR